MTLEHDLIAAVVAEPDAVEPRLVYSDHLQTAGDPRGELAVVQARLLAQPDDLELLARERELTTALTAALVQGTPMPATFVARWHLGFVDAIQLDVRTIRILRTTHRDWFAQPAFACVREVDIQSKFARTLRLIPSLGIAQTVRKLTFGEDSESLLEPTLAAIASRLPRLTALCLRCAAVPELRPLRPLALRELVLDVRNLTQAGIVNILEEPLRLETFGLLAGQVPEELHAVLAHLYTGGALREVTHFVTGYNLPVMVAIEALVTSGRAASVEKITGNFHRTPYDAQVGAEKHRAALARITFEPQLGLGEYYDTEGLAAVATFYNYRLDRPAEAIPYYERALRLRPEHVIARQNLGVALRKARRLQESLVVYDVMIAQAKQPTAAMYNGRHYTLCELNRRADAVADLERALAINPNFVDAWNNLGVERQYVGDVEGAFAAFRRCLELNPEHGYAPRNEADLFLELGRASEALPIYARLSAAKPDDGTLLAMLAHAELETGNALAARTIVEARLALPDHAQEVRLHVLRALARRELGEDGDADLATAATTTSCVGWYALTAYIRTLDDGAAWRRLVPDTLITPAATTEAFVGLRARPLRAVTLDDQLDCGEIGVMAALLAGDRTLAIARAHALVTAYDPTVHRQWWHSLSTVATLSGPRLAGDGYPVLRMILRAVRGRHPTADVMALR